MARYTSKQLKGYYFAKRKGITANDNYNIEYFNGITSAMYAHIRRCEQSEYGICQGTSRLSLRKLNDLASYIS